MALPSSGQITLNQVNVELGLSGTAQIGMNDSAVRGLFDVASGELKIWRWHNFTKERTEIEINYEKLETIMFESIKRHLISDAPIGIQLSGGIDSSILAWSANKIKGEGIKSFSINVCILSTAIRNSVSTAINRLISGITISPSDIQSNI